MRSSALPPEEGGAPDEPPPRKPYLPFRSPAFQQPVIGVSVNPGLTAVYTHWLSPGRVRCPGEERCLLCQREGLQRLWGGYILLRLKPTPAEVCSVAHITGHPVGRLVIAEITHGARQFVRWMRPPPRDWTWRGVGVDLRREKPYRTAPVSLRLWPAIALANPLPEPYDISQHLIERWPLAPLVSERTGE